MNDVRKGNKDTKLITYVPPIYSSSVPLKLEFWFTQNNYVPFFPVLPEHTINIPLKFWYNQNPGHAFPTITMQTEEIRYGFCDCCGSDVVELTTNFMKSSQEDIEKILEKDLQSVPMKIPLISLIFDYLIAQQPKEQLPFINPYPGRYKELEEIICQCLLLHDRTHLLTFIEEQLKIPSDYVYYPMQQLQNKGYIEHGISIRCAYLCMFSKYLDTPECTKVINKAEQFASEWIKSCTKDYKVSGMHIDTPTTKKSTDLSIVDELNDGDKIKLTIYGKHVNDLTYAEEIAKLLNAETIKK